jgi:hypothetical protein
MTMITIGQVVLTYTHRGQLYDYDSNRTASSHIHTQRAAI